MSSAKKIFLAVASGLVAVGIVLAGIGWALAGFDASVFSTQIDLRGDGAVVLGGVEVDDPTGLPLIDQIAEVGEVDTSPIDAPAAPEATDGSFGPTPESTPYVAVDLIEDMKPRLEALATFCIDKRWEAT